MASGPMPRAVPTAMALMLSSALFSASAAAHEHLEDAIPEGEAVSEDPLVRALRETQRALLPVLAPSR